MKEFANWLTTLDWSVIATTLIGLATVWGGSFIGLVVGIVKTRATKLNFEKALKELGIELKEEQLNEINKMRESIVSSLDDIQKSLLLKQDENAQARLEAIKQLSLDAEEALEEVEEMTGYTKGLN